MRIGIDCRMLSSGFGLGRYVQQLVKHLRQVDTENQYVLFVRKNNFDEVESLVSRSNNPLPTSPYEGEESSFKIVLADIPWYSFEEQLKFKKIIRQEKVDLMHFPHFNVPLFYNVPFVVTIHDLTMFHYPRSEATTRSRVIFWLKDKAHRVVIRHAVKKAKHIIATSEFTKEDVVETLCVPKEKITVTYQAPFEKGNGKWEMGNGSVLKKYKVDKPYILYVGAAYPHKNLERLVEAWKIFVDRHENKYQLVLVGTEDYFYKKLKLPITNYQLPIIFTGFVDDQELVELYENAHLYVFPSLYEGFGLPPLEAMSHGTPVISSNASCLPEVLGEAAMYFDPNNTEQMAEVMHQVLSDTDIQMQLHQNAREHLKRFSWEKLARKTVEIYERNRLREPLN